VFAQGCAGDEIDAGDLDGGVAVAAQGGFRDGADYAGGLGYECVLHFRKISVFLL